MESEIYLRKVKSIDQEELQKIADEYLVPLYGDQSKALRGWLTGSNYKTAWVAVDNEDKIMGLLVISDKPYRDYVKIATLLVKREFSGREIGSLLLKKAMEYMEKSEKGKVIVTVSESVSESLVFFLRNKFDIIHKVVGKYKPGVIEFILRYQGGKNYER